MTYEEFAGLRADAGLPVPPRERYDGTIEPAYMDTEMDKRDFSRLPPAALAEICSLCESLRSALRELEAQRREAARIREDRDDWRRLAERLRTDLAAKGARP